MRLLRLLLFILSGTLIALGAWEFFDLRRWAHGTCLVIALVSLITYHVWLNPGTEETQDDDPTET